MRIHEPQRKIGPFAIWRRGRFCNREAENKICVSTVFEKRRSEIANQEKEEEIPAVEPAEHMARMRNFPDCK